jgi:hypothetical protein
MIGFILGAVVAKSAAKTATRARRIAGCCIWFLTILWFAEIQGNLSAFHSDGRLLLACLISAIPAVWFHGFRFLRKRRTPAAWQSPPPPPPPPEYAAPPPPPAAVFPLLELRAPFTRVEVIAAFRRRSMELHPDHGGSTAMFRMLLAERERAMAMAT